MLIIFRLVKKYIAIKFYLIRQVFKIGIILGCIINMGGWEIKKYSWNGSKI